MNSDGYVTQFTSGLLCWDDNRPRSRSIERRSPESEMKKIVLVFSLIALATPSLAAPRPALEKMCRELVGKEEPEATDGKSHIGQLNVQRFSDCMMGAPRAAR
jgi:hypothetical protein